MGIYQGCRQDSFCKVFEINVDKLSAVNSISLKHRINKRTVPPQGPPSPTQTIPAHPPLAPSSGLRADDLAGPRLVFCPRVEMCDLHLHRLHLQVLRRDPTHFVSDLVALDGDVLALDAETDNNQNEDE